MLSNPPVTATTAWDRFRRLPWWLQVLAWVALWPVPVALFAASRPAGARRRWWALAAVAGLVWGGVAVVAGGGDGTDPDGPATHVDVVLPAAPSSTDSTATAGTPTAGSPTAGAEPNGAGADAGGTAGTSPSGTGLAPPASPSDPPATTGTTTTPPASGGPDPAPPTGDGSDLLARLRVAAEGPRAGYDRDLFRLWVDDDGDGCDTRREVLIEESVVAVSLGAGCAVTGQWFSVYDGVSTTDPSSFDIDHVVALAEAWDSGAAAWDATRRRAFANDLGYAGSLVAVSASSNRSKSDRDPAEWLPPRREAWCGYATDWATVKVRWDLTSEPAEIDALRSALATCAGAPPAPPPPPAESTTTTTTGPPPSGAAVTLSALDCGGEAVTVTNPGPAAADLTGWAIHDEGTKHTFAFPSGYTLAAGASVTVRSGGPAGPGELAWTGSSVWNNDGDVASLVDPAGAVVSTRTC